MEKLTRDVQALREALGIELQAHKEAQSLELQALGDSVGHELRAPEQRMNRNNEVLRSDIQRRFEAMVSHTLDGDGNVAFRVPPAGTLEEAEESPAGQGQTRARMIWVWEVWARKSCHSERREESEIPASGKVDFRRESGVLRFTQNASSAVGRSEQWKYIPRRKCASRYGFSPGPPAWTDRSSSAEQDYSTSPRYASSSRSTTCFTGRPVAAQPLASSPCSI